MYGELKNYSDEDKQVLSDNFADRYDGKLGELIEFISDSRIAVEVRIRRLGTILRKIEIP